MTIIKYAKRYPFVLGAYATYLLLVSLTTLVIGHSTGVEKANKQWFQLVNKAAQEQTLAQASYHKELEDKTALKEAELLAKENEIKEAKETIESLKAELVSKASNSSSASEQRWQKLLIDAGFAEYHPKTGKWRLLTFDDVATTAIVLGHGKLPDPDKKK